MKIKLIWIISDEVRTRNRFKRASLLSPQGSQTQQPTRGQMIRICMGIYRKIDKTVKKYCKKATQTQLFMRYVYLNSCLCTFWPFYRSYDKFPYKFWNLAYFHEINFRNHISTSRAQFFHSTFPIPHLSNIHLPYRAFRSGFANKTSFSWTNTLFCSFIGKLSSPFKKKINRIK